MLTVGDDELTVRDDDNALSEVAEGGHRKLTWTEQQAIQQASSRLLGEAGVPEAPRVPIYFVITFFIVIFIFYSLLQIQ